MYATTPPTENQLATRAAILTVARAKLAPLFEDATELDALPAWLWSLPTQAIAKALALDAIHFARELALDLEAETASRHPAERFVTYMAKHHPLLSHVQRARLAEFAQVFHAASQTHWGPVTKQEMITRGFTADECERLTPRAVELIKAVDAEPARDATGEPQTERTPADMLRAAGELAHTRRAYATGDLELSAAAAARVTPARVGARA